ncbi:putative short-chain dehydrogenase reductase family protein [Botrytis cinerea BcDW1]|uniref:Short-chain dehydrogenase/reductase ABA4 n=1 Tax=Botryotinia fuckeliana (strain BcDW1) TaxID=1290391 RepID=M7UFP8_BOTF1|nr:putative short-chain dehydrogenase reductase family protein [Botrytis cinerea BcDW1]
MSNVAVNGIALVTGGAAGIGEETGFVFAEAGASGVIFADLSIEGAKASAEKSREFATNPQYRTLALEVNTTEPESVQAMVDFTIKKFGQIDYFVNSAGVGATSLAPTSDIDIDNFDKTFAVDARGTMLCLRAVTKAMVAQEPRKIKGRHGDERLLGRGCIVNLGSGLSYGVGPGMMAYVASKHAVMGITKVAALDNAKHGIRVNALCPCWYEKDTEDVVPTNIVKTPMLERSLSRWADLKKVIQTVSPAKRAATPEEVANVAVFLCSPSASYINGTGLLIDAGMMITAHAS